MISSFWSPSNELARIRWPVDETGRNSVRPSTMPMATALINNTTSTLRTPGGPGGPSDTKRAMIRGERVRGLSARLRRDAHRDALRAHLDGRGLEVEAVHLVGLG